MLLAREQSPGYQHDGTKGLTDYIITAEANEPVERLQGVLGQVGAVDKRLLEIDTDHQKALGDWLAAGSMGERPNPAPESVVPTQLRASLMPDAAAALRSALDARQRLANALTDASRRRDEAIAVAAGETARDFAPRLAAASRGFLEIEGQLLGVAVALTAAGNQPGATPLFGSHAAAVRELIAETKRGIAVHADLERGMHALRSRMDVKAYAASVGRARTTVHDEVYAAEVIEAVPDVRNEVVDQFSQLVAIHAAPRWLWPAWARSELAIVYPRGKQRPVPPDIGTLSMPH